MEAYRLSAAKAPSGFKVLSARFVPSQLHCWLKSVFAKQSQLTGNHLRGCCIKTHVSGDIKPDTPIHRHVARPPSVSMSTTRNVAAASDSVGHSPFFSVEQKWWQVLKERSVGQK